MNKKVLKFFLSALLVISFAAGLLPAAAAAQSAGSASVAAVNKTGYESALQTIEDKLEVRRKELGIPGVSLVIVKDDQIIYLKGLGYKDFENKVAVTPDTQFAIGSATKAFTALTVLMSQDEGKLSLDDSPKKYLPYFKMYDPDTDKNITIRDLMDHSSGLNRTDLAMITGKLNRAELIQVAGQAKPTAKLREKFQYQNIMFVAAGEIAETVEKQPYEKLVAQRIFKPLGMSNSNLSIAEMEKAKDHSLGYSYNFDTKETKKLPYREIAEIAPAGSINSSARDMAQWLRFVINGGTVNGKRLISEKGYDEWLKPQMKIAGKTSYGFGWFLQDWNGLKVVQHGGNIDGFNSQVAMIPEKKIGFVLLTNVSASSLGSDLMPVIWSNIVGESKPTASHALPPKTANTAAMANSPGAIELVGKYTGPNGGTIEIKEGDGKVTFNIGGQQPYALAERSTDVYSMIPLPDAYSLKAKRAADGKVMSVVVSQPEGDFEFKRTESKPDDKPAITVDELAAKSVEAAGGEANWRKLNSRIFEFSIDFENQGVRAFGRSYSKAPNKSASETTFIALDKKIATEWQFFDGAMGADLVSFGPPANYSGKQLEDVRLSADFYGPLDWKVNYKKIEITGTAKVAGEDAYVVAFEPEKGTAFKEYYSTGTFLLLKHDGLISSSTSSQQIPFSVLYSDYREVDGVKLPFKTVNNNIGYGIIVTVITSVKHNVPVDDKLFVQRNLK
jgi:CubicO group peptidase (beta-lactamase class C family)